jgi:hypothetical protein
MSQPMYPGSPQQGPYGPGGASPKKSNVVLIIVIVVGVAFLGIAGLGVVAAFGIFATTKVISDAKAAEGKITVGALARAMVNCAEQETVGADPSTIVQGGLPPTSVKVPASMPAGKRYATTTSDWSDPAFMCARFSLSEPQFFQYQWILVTPGELGTVRAEADLNGDGAVDVAFEQDVSCRSTGASVTCSIGALRETQR